MPSATYGFLGKPESLQKVNAGSYTIPANKYGWVAAWCRSGGAVTADGTTILGSVANTWTGLSSDNLKVFTGVSVVDFNGGGGSANAANILASSYAGMLSDANNYSTSAAFNTTTFSDSTQGQAGFWAPTGTVLSGSGTYGFVVSVFAD